MMIFHHLFKNKTSAVRKVPAVINGMYGRENLTFIKVPFAEKRLFIPDVSK